MDTAFYTSAPLTLKHIIRHPVLTPLNNIIYNSNSKNLADHGLHPFYQHFIANLPQLLGPAYLLIFSLPRITLPLISAASGIFLLSLFKHQEARFLIPTIPLLLSSVQPPKRHFKIWVVAWVGFNAVLGILMGIYHQGGVVPTQNRLAGEENVTEVLWWRTYSPPTWLLDGKNEHVRTTVLMGMRPDLLAAELSRATAGACHAGNASTGIYLVAPRSSTFLDRYENPGSRPDGLRLESSWHYSKHLNLDDLDFVGDGLWRTLKRVIGRRGLTTWRVIRRCD